MKAEDLIWLSFGHCPRCGGRHCILWSNDEAYCTRCGAGFILVTGDDGALVDAVAMEGEECQSAEE